MVTGYSDKYEDFLRIQVTTSFRGRDKVPANETQLQQVETIPPLKEQVQGDIPEHVGLEWSHRARWPRNRCLTLIYGPLRKVFVSMWFYYIPFVALTINFLAPYQASLNAPPPAQMDEAYLDFIAQTLGAEDVVSNYTEPSVKELVKMMEDIPMMNKKWGMFTDILVLPLSLD